MTGKEEESERFAIFSAYADRTGMHPGGLCSLLGEIIMNARLPMAFLDPKGTVLIWNKAAGEITGYPEEEILGNNTIWKLLYPDPAYREEVTGTIREIVERGDSPRKYETDIITKTGETRTMAWNTSVMSGAGGKPAGFIVLAEDVTERKRMEALVKESEEKFRIVADFTYDWEYWLSPESRFVYVTPSCERMTGYTPEDFYRDPDLFYRMTHPEDLPVLDRHMDNIFSSENPEMVDYRIVKKDGGVIWISHICQPVFGKDGELRGRRGSNRDITVRKEAEAEVKASHERYLTYVKEAAMRMKTPVEVVEQNLATLLSDIESGDLDRDLLAPRIRLQVKNMEQIRGNIIDLNRTIVDAFGEISPGSRKFLME